MSRMGFLSLYGSIFLLISAIIVFVVANAGLKGTLYGLGILIIIGIFIYFLTKLPDLLARGIVLGITIIFFSIFLQSWLFTCLFIITAIADIATEGLCKKSRISKLASFSFIIVILIGSVWLSAYDPTIEQQILHDVEKEIKAEDGVYNVTIYMNNGIDCIIVVDDKDMTFAERQQLGEKCGKRISDKVNPKRDVLGHSDGSIGYLYDYHSLHIDVFTRKEDDRLRGIKYTYEENINWYEEESVFDDEI